MQKLNTIPRKTDVRSTSLFGLSVVTVLFEDGVATIASFGGEEKIFEVQANPVEMKNYDITPFQLFKALEDSNINVGGDIIKKGSQAYVVRGIGLLESLEDIENLLVDVKGNSPIRVKQIASVSVSSRPRQGQVGLKRCAAAKTNLTPRAESSSRGR